MQEKLFEKKKGKYTIERSIHFFNHSNDLITLPDPYAEIGSRNPSLSLCNVNMFCIVQCSYRVLESESVPISVSSSVI